MFYTEHGVPHFHARYGEFAASIEITSGKLHGYLPRRAHAMVREWLRIHRGHLLENWHRARDGMELRPIPPLE